MTTNASSHSARERYAYIAAPILAVVMAGVAWMNLAPTRHPIRPPAKPPIRATALGTGASVTTGPTAQWPAVDIETMTAFDPFDREAVRATVASPSSDASGETSVEAEVNESKIAVHAVARAIPEVQAIYRAGDRVVALVDSRIVHAGDLLGGRRVLKILPDRLVLAPSEDSATFGSK